MAVSMDGVWMVKKLLSVIYSHPPQLGAVFDAKPTMMLSMVLGKRS